MVLNKIPTFQEVKDWANSNLASDNHDNNQHSTNYADTNHDNNQHSANYITSAPVQSVNSQTGTVTVPSRNVVSSGTMTADRDDREFFWTYKRHDSTNSEVIMYTAEITLSNGVNILGESSLFYGDPNTDEKLNVDFSANGNDKIAYEVYYWD